MEFVKIEDLKSDNGRLLESDKLLQARLSPVHFFKLMDIVSSIPNESVEAYYQQNLRHIYPSSNDTFEINIEKVTVNVLKVQYFENPFTMNLNAKSKRCLLLRRK